MGTRQSGEQKGSAQSRVSRRLRVFGGSSGVKGVGDRELKAQTDERDASVRRHAGPRRPLAGLSPRPLVCAVLVLGTGLGLAFAVAQFLGYDFVETLGILADIASLTVVLTGGSRLVAESFSRQ